MIEVNKKELSVNLDGIRPSYEINRALDELVEAALEAPASLTPIKKKRALRALDITLSAMLMGTKGIGR